MKKDKEYPATHSMDTAWYIVDDEGNVGFLECEDNGPVPYGFKEGESFDWLVFGYFDGRSKDKTPIALTKPQLESLLVNPHTPEEEERWSWHCYVRIDPAQEADFLKLCRKPDIEEYQCVSQTECIYSLEADRCLTKSEYRTEGEEEDLHYTESKPQKTEQIKPESTLRKMIDRKMILEVYELTAGFYFIKAEHEEFPAWLDNFPYYVYVQPYPAEEGLPKRIAVPKDPVKIDQVPKNLRRKMLKVPGKFKDMETVQILESYLCHIQTFHDIEIDGYRYCPSLMADGTPAYFLADYRLEIYGRKRKDIERGLAKVGKKLPYCITAVEMRKLCEEKNVRYDGGYCSLYDTKE